jgi:hypothetical protein
VEQGVALIERLLCDCVFGAFSLSGTNIGLSHELNSLLRGLPFARRYSLYAFWMGPMYDTAPEISNARVEVMRAVKYFMRRLAKENVKTMRRQFAHFAIAQPLIVMDACLKEVWLNHDYECHAEYLAVLVLPFITSAGEQGELHSHIH